MGRVLPSPLTCVYSLEEARACFEVSQRDGLPLRVISPPSVGGLYWLSLWEAASATPKALTLMPPASIIALDCGADSGQAIAALRCGVRDLVISCSPVLEKSLQRLADALEARLWKHLNSNSLPCVIST